MSELLATVEQFFRSNDWPMAETEMQDVLKVPFVGQNGHWDCYARVRGEQDQFVFYSQLPFTVPDNKKTEVSLLLTRLNFGLILGNFEFDFEEGHVRYKTSIGVKGDRLTVALIEQMVYANVNMVDHHFPEIESVIEDRSEN